MFLVVTKIIESAKLPPLRFRFHIRIDFCLPYRVASKSKLIIWLAVLMNPGFLEKAWAFREVA